MFKAFCEKIGLTKSNIRTIRRIWNAIKYPPIDWEKDEFARALVSFFCAIVAFVGLCLVLGLGFEQVPLGWSVVFLIFSFWVIRWLFYGIGHLVPSAIRTVWNEIPEEGRKKKKREDMGLEGSGEELYESEAIASLSEQGVEHVQRYL